MVKTNPARRLYERLGFRVTHEDGRKFYIRREPGNHQSKLITNRLPTMNRYVPNAISSVRFDMACAALTPGGAVRRLNGVTRTAPISET